jgi:hypothetical protein
VSSRPSSAAPRCVVHQRDRSPHGAPRGDACNGCGWGIGEWLGNTTHVVGSLPLTSQQTRNLLANAYVGSNPAPPPYCSAMGCDLLRSQPIVVLWRPLHPVFTHRARHMHPLDRAVSGTGAPGRRLSQVRRWNVTPWWWRRPRWPWDAEGRSEPDGVGVAAMVSVPISGAVRAAGRCAVATMS